MSNVVDLASRRYSKAVDVAVIGAGGFLGGAVAKHLAEEGLSVLRNFHSTERAHQVLGSDGTFHERDIGDPNQLAVSLRGVDTVVNAAGIHPRSHERALRWTYIAGAQNVLAACKRAGVKRLVHISSGDVTAAREKRMNWDEERLPAKPLNDPYVRAKRLSEEVIMADAMGEVEVIVLRPAPLWGPGALELFKLMSHGLVLPRRGSSLVSTCYIDHAVQCIAASVTGSPKQGRCYYISDGELDSAMDFFTPLAEAIGAPAPKPGLPVMFELAKARSRRKDGDHQGMWPLDVVRWGYNNYFNWQRAHVDLGYTPNVSRADGFAATRSWIEERGGLGAALSDAKRPREASSVDRQVEAAGGD